MSFVMSRGLSASSAKLDSFAVNTKKGVTLQCRTVRVAPLWTCGVALQRLSSPPVSLISLYLVVRF